MISLVQEYFSESAGRYPDKTAVSCQDDSISYSDLEDFSNGFARILISRGVTRQSFVPFFLAKSIKSIQAMLAILKSDCAYVPIDIHSPAQRLLSIIDSTAAEVIIVDNESQILIESLLPDSMKPELINIDQVELLDVSAIEYKNLSIDIAYVLFTSGSTGTPKGVMIPHRAIVDYIDWCVETYEINDKDIIANHAPLYFDNSTFDIYTAFKSSATLHMVHEDLNMVLPSLVKWIAEREITTFFCVPSVLTLLMQSRRLKDDSFPKLRHVIAAGEPLPPVTLKFWMEKYTNIQFTNMYGPTEITVDCSYYQIHKVPTSETSTIPIGLARKNMELFIRENTGALSQACGAKGELLVRGTSVAYGYLGDVQKTSESFIQNPLHNNYHDPIYCTGDIVEINADGEFLFVGRADDQIKFLGHRIELGEIESALNAIPSVTEAVVCFKSEGEFSAPHAEIGALVSMADKNLELLVDQLKQRLPGYMLPTRIEIFDQVFPRTANGKYDRKAISQILFALKVENKEF